MGKTLKDFFECYDSVAAFSAALSDRKNINNCNTGAITDDDVSFYGSATFEEAEDLLNGGDLSSLEKLEEACVNIKKTTTKETARIITDVCGFSPVVPLAVIGMPDNMMTFENFRVPEKVVNIVYNPDFNCQYSAYQLADAGGRFLSIVRGLEKNGVRCNVYAGNVSADKKCKQYVGCLIKVKNASAPLNVLRLAYPLVNAGFKRRHFFRWIETAPTTLQSDFLCGIFYPKKLKNHINAFGLKNTIVITGTELLSLNINNACDALCKQIDEM